MNKTTFTGKKIKVLCFNSRLLPSNIHETRSKLGDQ